MNEFLHCRYHTLTGRSQQPLQRRPKGREGSDASNAKEIQGAFIVQQDSCLVNLRCAVQIPDCSNGQPATIPEDTKGKQGSDVISHTDSQVFALIRDCLRDEGEI